MKQKMAAIVTIIIFIVALIIISYAESHYTRQAHVVYLDDCTDTITVQDDTLNIWKFYGDTESFTQNENVTLRMYNNYTDLDITDDEIIKIERRNYND